MGVRERDTVRVSRIDRHRPRQLGQGHTQSKSSATLDEHHKLHAPIDVFAVSYIVVVVCCSLLLLLLQFALSHLPAAGNCLYDTLHKSLQVSFSSLFFLL